MGAKGGRRARRYEGSLLLRGVKENVQALAFPKIFNTEQSKPPKSEYRALNINPILLNVNRIQLNDLYSSTTSVAGEQIASHRLLAEQSDAPVRHRAYWQSDAVFINDVGNVKRLFILPGRLGFHQRWS